MALLRVVAGLGLILAAGAFACSAATPGVCVPGRQTTCVCPGGSRGLQSCLPDGSGYETCSFCVSARQGFTDVTAELGLPPNAGPCMGFGDFDKDGNLDLILSNMGASGGANGPTTPALIEIYAGNGGGKFSKVATVTSGFSMLCAVADFDRDGLPDFVIGQSANQMKNETDSSMQLWKNTGGFKFEYQQTGFDDPYLHGDRQMFGMSLLDFDKDGWLDVVVGRARGGGGLTPADCYFKKDYSDFACHGQLVQGMPPPQVYRNDKGTFKAVPNLITSPAPGTTNAIAFADLDRDGETDVFMSNDWYFNMLLLRKSGGYQHHEKPCAVDEYNHGMGAAIADYNGDGLYDIYGADLGPNNLWMQNANHTFTNQNMTTGVAAATRYHSNWAPLGEDFDLDGRPDIFVASSGVVVDDEDMPKMAVIQGVPKPTQQYDVLFWNDGAAGWSTLKLNHRPGQQASVVFASSALGDPDGDGDLDILVGAGVPLQFRYLRNDQPHGNYLVVALEGTASTKEGIGAEVSLLEGGKVVQMRTVGSQGSLGSSWRRAHFGLGAAKSVEEVRVRWPTGKTQSLGHADANQTLVVKEP